jgi:hypothetical protein
MQSISSRPLRACALSVLGLALAAGSTLAQGNQPKDTLNTAASTPTKYGKFKVEADEKGIWWFVGPDGKRFVSIGVDNVIPKAWNPRPNSTYYNAVDNQFKGDSAAWAADTQKLLLDHGFNTLGAWSHFSIPASPKLLRTIVLYVTGHESDRCLDALLPGFEERVLKFTREEMAKYNDHEHLLGVFLDNEMPWYGRSGWDNIANYTLLEKALELDPSNPRRDVAVKFLKDKYKTTDALAKAYERPLASWAELTSEWVQNAYSEAVTADRQEFTALAADAFYTKAAAVVRKELPGVLILGTRFAGDAPTPVIVAAGKVSDVVAFNDYNGQPRANMDLYTRYWLLTKRPIMLTEYSWRGKDNQSGNPNSRGAGPVVATQDQRAANYAAFVPDALATPVLIGAHWFEFADQSPEGRFDGEDSNYGIVDIHNNRYEKLLAAMKAANSSLHQIHASSARQMPTEFPKAKPVTYSPAQHPNRPPTLEILGRNWTSDPEIWGAKDSKLSWAWGSQTSSELVLTYTTGSEYGCGINLFGPKASALKSGPAGATDLDGYQNIVLEATAPQNLEILVVMGEAAVGPSSQAEFSKASGDDGEAYISDVVRGKGQRATYTFPISRLTRQIFHGNQHGGQNIDMQAIKNLGLQLRGNPQSGTVTLHSFRLEK